MQVASLSTHNIQDIKSSRASSELVASTGSTRDQYVRRRRNADRNANHPRFALRLSTPRHYAAQCHNAIIPCHAMPCPRSCRAPSQPWMRKEKDQRKKEKGQRVTRLGTQACLRLRREQRAATTTTPLRTQPSTDYTLSAPPSAHRRPSHPARATSARRRAQPVQRPGAYSGTGLQAHPAAARPASSGPRRPTRARRLRLHIPRL
ncbi:hypothetical protein BKA81DRAFT_20440 [Phyllosticta paracitricarpa]